MLLDNVCLNKRASSGKRVEWDDVVAICRDSLAGVYLAKLDLVPAAATSSVTSVQVPSVPTSILQAQ